MDREESSSDESGAPSGAPARTSLSAQPVSLEMIIGDETGLVKCKSHPVLNFQEKNSVRSYGEQAMGKNVRTLLFDEEGCVVVGRKSGEVDVINDQSKQMRQLLPPLREEMVGMVVCEGKVARLLKSGKVMVEQSTFKADGNLPSHIVSKGSLAAIGSKNMTAQIYDIPQCKQVWKAKNLKKTGDSLNSELPVYDTKCHWLGENLLATCTAFNEVRIYDIRTGKRPVRHSQLNRDTDNSYYPLYAITSSPDSRFIFTGDSIGHIYKLDIGDLRMVGKIKEVNVGAVRDLQCTGTMLVSCGLDRYVKAYGQETLELQDRALLWQKLNVMLVNSA